MEEFETLSFFLEMQSCYLWKICTVRVTSSFVLFWQERA